MGIGILLAVLLVTAVMAGMGLLMAMLVVAFVKGLRPKGFRTWSEQFEVDARRLHRLIHREDEGDR